ncbi:MAG: hypothetical protein OER77_12290 [Myxococcales bacterium]|nr:hypothetical protein [Myxococcales bacterium]
MLPGHRLETWTPPSYDTYAPRDFTPPTNADWVLVIDDDAAMLPAPGTGTVLPDPDGGAGSGGTEPNVYVFRCDASAPGQDPSTPWCLVVLGAWVLIERRRLRRG